jgi:hypothetical protein
MPPLIAALPGILAIAAPVASIAAAGTTIGLDIANAGGPSAPKPTAPAGPTPAQQAQEQTQLKAAVGQQLPTLEGLTSGFANPGYYASQGALNAGVAGQPGGQNAAMAAVEKALGLPPGSLTGGATGGGTPTKFTPAGVGNSTAAGAFPQNQVNLSEFVDSFMRA